MLDIKVIPGFSRYGITEDARLFNLETGKELKTSPNTSGYRATTLVNDAGERKVLRRHRAVAMAHIPLHGNFDDFTVNHINAIPGDDYVSNLEWLSIGDNVRHWFSLGIDRKKYVFETFNLNTSEIIKYTSLSACGADIGLTSASIKERLSKPENRVWDKSLLFRTGHSDGKWPTDLLDRNGRDRDVAIKDLVTGKVSIFATLSELKRFINYKTPTLWVRTNDKSQPIQPGLYQTKFLDDDTPWRESEDFILDLQKTMNCKIIAVESDGEFECYTSAMECCRSHDVKPTALNHRLNLKGKGLFDQKRFWRYEDLTDIQKEKIRYEVLERGCVQRPSKATVVLPRP